MKPGKLPSNDFAFNNILYLSRQDYATLRQASGLQAHQSSYVKAKSMVLKVDQLAELEAGTYGASSLQKEALRLSKIDNLVIRPANVKPSPLESLQVSVTQIWRDESFEFGK